MTTVAATHTDTDTTVVSFINLIRAHGEVVEVRALNCVDAPGRSYQYTLAGYFDDIDKAAEAVTRLDAQRRAPGIYMTLNPVLPDLLARANNRLTKLRTTTRDTEIVRRRWFFLDVDAVRPPGISSTETELESAHERALSIQADLTAAGWPVPIRAMSGNGNYLIFRVDLPTDDGALLERVLHALHDRYSDADVKVDRAVHNPARIIKIIGTFARKGDHTAERPHRRSALIDVPDSLDIVPRSLLEQAASASTTTTATTATLPDYLQNAAPDGQVELSQYRDNGHFQQFENTPAGVRQFLESNGVTVKAEKVNTRGTWLYLDQCPIVRDCVSENASDIGVHVRSDRKIIYHNLHERGDKLTWLDLREQFEPGYKAHVQSFKDDPAPNPNRTPGAAEPDHLATLNQRLAPLRIARAVKWGTHGATFDLALEDGTQIRLGTASDVLTPARAQSAIADATRIVIRNYTRRAWRPMAAAIFAMAEHQVTGDKSPEQVLAGYLLDWLENEHGETESVDITNPQQLAPKLRHNASVFRDTDGRIYVYLPELLTHLNLHERIPGADVRQRLIRLGFKSQRLSARDSRWATEKDAIAKRWLWVSQTSFEDS